MVSFQIARWHVLVQLGGHDDDVKCLVSGCAFAMVCRENPSGEDHYVRPFRRRSILVSSEETLVPSLAEGPLHCLLTVYNQFAPPPLGHTYRIFDRGKLSYLVAPGLLQQTYPVFCRGRNILLVSDSPEVTFDDCMLG